MTKKIFAIWIDGLAAALIQIGVRFRPGQRFQIRANSRPPTLYQLEQSGLPTVYSLEGQQLDALSQEFLTQTRGATFEILVPAAAIQERRLDVLPAESLPYAENVVLHQIESMFPWPAEDVMHATTIERRSDGKLDVSVRATSRSAIAPALALAKACGAGEILVVRDSEDAGDKRVAAIVASIGEERKKELDRARVTAQYAIIALVVFAASVLGWSGFTGWSLAGDITVLDQAIAERHAILQRSSSSDGTVQDRGLEAKKRLSPLAVVVLDELSSILPNDTYLTDLSLESGQLRISGISANAAELVPLLEGSGGFKNASFAAPTTRIAGSTRDRFSIEAVVEPRGATTP